MKTIVIDDSIYASLEKLVQGFDDKPNEVIKRLLDV
jgi:predicted CopG family antitoxin